MVGSSRRRPGYTVLEAPPDLLQKPFGLQALARKIRTALGPRKG